MVIFGGVDFSGNVLNDTWVWDGNNWSQQLPARSPSPRQGHAMAYDAPSGQVVLFGGITEDPTGESETWVWDGNNWTQKTPVHSPSGRFLFTMAYDEASAQIVLFGGEDLSSDRNLSDTWIWNGSDWIQQTPAHSPSARSGQAMAYEASSRQVVLFGGLAGRIILGDTWVWAGSDWTELNMRRHPEKRFIGAMAGDAARAQVVLFGGEGGAQGSAVVFGDTWVWEASN
jgi:hypothetical protein